MLARTVELLDAVDRVLQAEEDFEEPDQGYWDIIEHCLTTFREGDLPAACRPISEIVGRIAPELDRVDAEGIPLGRTRYYALLKQLAAERNKAEPRQKTIEPIEMLVEQGVNPKQICAMYGLVDASGPRLDWLRQERENPGTVLGPVVPHPDEASRQEVEAFRTAREEFQGKNPERQKASREPEDQPCHESWEELFALRPPVSIQQLAAMKCCTPAEVVRMARKLKAVEHLPIAERTAVERAERDKSAKPAKKTAKAASPPPDDLEDDDPEDGSGTEGDEVHARIAELHKEGTGPKEIAELLGVDGRTVAAVIRKLEKQAVAV